MTLVQEFLASVFNLRISRFSHSFKFYLHKYRKKYIIQSGDPDSRIP